MSFSNSYKIIEWKKAHIRILTLLVGHKTTLRDTPPHKHDLYDKVVKIIYIGGTFEVEENGDRYEAISFSNFRVFEEF